MTILCVSYLDRRHAEPNDKGQSLQLLARGRSGHAAPGTVLEQQARPQAGCWYTAIVSSTTQFKYIQSSLHNLGSTGSAGSVSLRSFESVSENNSCLQQEASMRVIRQFIKSLARPIIASRSLCETSSLVLGCDDETPKLRVAAHSCQLVHADTTLFFSAQLPRRCCHRQEHEVAGSKGSTMSPFPASACLRGGRPLLDISQEFATRRVAFKHLQF